ncbi:MAG: pseudouridine synthase [Marinomonas sp.]|uniref:pseudouridine synthase n=1 Tax=unclassified Marinomonas TaxID=196814 RepID=UPI0005FA44EA|nr:MULTISPECIES: 16S rRNA pseudouridine(516) synthase [unclassified Marinomonas]KJZ15276.1 16S rRNA pseudouridylate synthase [Marinomonas sp. S3726]KZM41432.1 16S rRNA pseudouridylate synthase [Marinomonas sp. SBI22]KZM43268.1 16S rRNA pseudouridylate synthase [Marinomonas sp. SBI8L]
MRLDYYLAHAANLSRKEAKIAIAKGRVLVNGESKLKANTSVTDSCDVILDKKSLSFQQNRYYMMHKPEGVVCALQDDEHSVVLDLLPNEIKKELKVVGRLDKDTTGLLLLTTDGQWLHKITSPKHDCPKTYLVDLADKIEQDAVNALEQGVLLNGEIDLTKPAKVVVHSDKQISLTISEGKYHQVKRMLAAVGNKVEALHRSQIGALVLPEALPLGEFQELSQEQAALLA